MLSNLILSFEAVAPMFITIIIGYILRLGKIVDMECIKKVNTVLFKVCFPMLVLNNLYGSSMEEAFDIKLISYSVSMSLFMWLASIPIVMKLEKDNPTRGTMIQGINRTNYLVIGFPIINRVCAGEKIAATALSLVGMLFVSNIMAVVVLEVFRGNKPGIKHILKSIITNPIVLATIAGTIIMVFELKLPEILETTMKSLANSATTIALLMMGATIEFKNLSEEKRNLTITVLGKLIIVPGIATALGALLGFRGTAFVVLLAFFSASPTVTSYTMAEQMGNNAELARDNLVLATALVPFTMFCWIFFYKTIGMF